MLRRRAFSSTEDDSDAVAVAGRCGAGRAGAARAGRMDRASSIGGERAKVSEPGLASHPDRQIVLHSRGIDLVVAGERIAELDDDGHDLARNRGSRPRRLARRARGSAGRGRASQVALRASRRSARYRWTRRCDGSRAIAWVHQRSAAAASPVISEDAGVHQGVDVIRPSRQRRMALPVGLGDCSASIAGAPAPGRGAGSAGRVDGAPQRGGGGRRSAGLRSQPGPGAGRRRCRTGSVAPLRPAVRARRGRSPGRSATDRPRRGPRAPQHPRPPGPGEHRAPRGAASAGTASASPRLPRSRRSLRLHERSPDARVCAASTAPSIMKSCRLTIAAG